MDNQAPYTEESTAQIFRAELEEKITGLESLLQVFEDRLRDGKPSIEAIHLAMRYAHSLKGMLGMADQAAASRAMHAMESIFVGIRTGHSTLSRPVFDLAFELLDRLSQLLVTGREDTAAFDSLTERWTAIGKVDRSLPPRPLRGLPFPLSAVEQSRLQAAIAANRQVFLVEKVVLSDCEESVYDNLPILSDIGRVGTLIARRPSFETLDRSHREAVVLLVFCSAMPLPDIQDIVLEPFRPVELTEQDCQGWTQPRKPATFKSLVVEDDFTSRMLLQRILAPYGEAHVAVDGEEALLAVQLALESGHPYELICLDIMMPKLDGQETLKGLRAREDAHGLPIGTGAKVIMTTCLKDSGSVMAAFREQCDAYLVKPIDRGKLVKQLQKLDLLPP